MVPFRSDVMRLDDLSPSRRNVVSKLLPKCGHTPAPASARKERLDDFGVWCGRRDLNPHSPCGKTDFLTRPRLSPPLLSCQGLGSGLSLHRARIWLRVSGAARLVSTPSRPFSGRAWLGIAMLQGSPNLSSSTPPVSRWALKFSLKSVASADFATPARSKVSTNGRVTRSDF